MNRMMLACVAACLTLGAAAGAQAQMKPDEVLKARQGLYRAVQMTMGPLGAMAKGDMPYNAETVAAAADKMQAAWKLLGPTYAPQYANLPNSNAKPEIWAANSTVGEKNKAFQEAVAKLAASANDEAAGKAAIGQVGKACKSCHDDFRKE